MALDHSTESTGSGTDNNGFEYSTDTEDHESGHYSLDSESPQVRHENIISEKEKAGVVSRGHNITDNYYYEYGRCLLSSKSNSISDLRSDSRQDSIGHVDQNSTRRHEQRAGQKHYVDEDPSDEEEEEESQQRLGFDKELPS